MNLRLFNGDPLNDPEGVIGARFLDTSDVNDLTCIEVFHPLSERRTNLPFPGHKRKIITHRRLCRITSDPRPQLPSSYLPSEIDISINSPIVMKQFKKI